MWTIPLLCTFFGLFYHIEQTRKRQEEVTLIYIYKHIYACIHPHDYKFTSLLLQEIRRDKCSFIQEAMYKVNSEYHWAFYKYTALRKVKKKKNENKHGGF